VQTIENLKRINVSNYILHFSINERYIGADAPINDLKLFQDKMAYIDVHQEVAEIVLQKLEKHCWYLIEKITICFSSAYKHRMALQA